MNRTFPSLASKISTLSSIDPFELQLFSSQDMFSVNYNMSNDHNIHSNVVVIEEKSPLALIPINELDQNAVHTIDQDSGYTALPFAGHHDHNVFPSDLKNENKSTLSTFQESMSDLIKDWKQLFNVKSNRTCVILLIAAGCNVGAYNGFSSILQDMMSPIGFTENTIGYIGASSMISQIIGALIGGQIVDRYFSGKLKKCILFAQCMENIWFLIGCLVLPNVLNGNEVIVVIENYVLRLIVFLSIAIGMGFAFGVTLFLYFELLAEIACPIAEASLANAVYVVGLPLMTVLIAIGSINTSITCRLSLVCVVVAFVLDTFVVEKYGRPQGITVLQSL